MIANLKALGLALVAVFAMSAVAASVASAQQGKLTSTGPVTLTGEETGGTGSNAITVFGLKIECPGSTYTGHKYNVTPHTYISSGSTTATLTPHFKQANHNCKSSPGGFPVTIHMNGCDYVVHLGETTGGVAGTYGVTFDIICPVGKEITLTTFTTTAAETEGKAFCAVHIKEQLGLKGAHATDTGNGHIGVSGTIEGMHALRKNATGPADTHTLFCPKETTTNTGRIDIDITVFGENAAHDATSISLSE